MMLMMQFVGGKKNLCIQKGKEVGITREQNKVSRENSSEALKKQ